jgi:hypothetical protein
MDNRNEISPINQVESLDYQAYVKACEGLSQAEIEFCELILLGKSPRACADEVAGNLPFLDRIKLTSMTLNKPAVKLYLAHRRKEIYAATDITRERVAEEVKSITFLDPIKIFDEFGEILEPHLLPDEVRRCIKEVEVDLIYEGSGEHRRVVGKKYKYKFYDKLNAASLIAKMYGLNAPEKHLVAGVIASLPNDLSKEELIKLARGENPAPDPEPTPARRRKAHGNRTVFAKEDKEQAISDIDWQKVEETKLAEDENERTA